MEREELIRKYNEKIEKQKLETKARLIYLWNNLKHFNIPNDVPDIPIVNKDYYNEFYVPKLIEAGAIPKKDLIDNQVYIGKHRRCTIAKWNAKDNHFEYWRNKFGGWFHDTCNHFEDDNGYALFVPIKLGTEEDFKIPEN